MQLLLRPNFKHRIYQESNLLKCKLAWRKNFDNLHWTYKKFDVRNAPQMT